MKRLLSILLIACMLLTFMPVMAFGDGEVTLKVDPTAIYTDAPARAADATYNTLADAVAAAAAGDTISLVANVPLESAVEINKDLTLDLNGKGITKTAPSGSVDAALIVKGGSNLTVTGTGSIVSNDGATHYGTPITINPGGTANTADNYEVSTVTLGSGVTVTGGYAGAYVYDNGKLVVDGATVQGYWYGIVPREAGAVIEVKGGEVKGTATGLTGSQEAIGISGNGTNGVNSSTITISGGTVSGETAGIYHPQPGTLTITGGTIEGGTALEIKGGSATISGNAILNATGSEAGPNDNRNGLSTVGYAVAVVENAVYGGSSATISATISGGKLTGGIKKLQDTEHSGNTYNFTVSGGEFTDLANAVEYATADATIKLLADINIDSEIAITKALTIDLNGHEITRSANEDLFWIHRGGSLTLTGTGTIKNTKADGTGDACAVYVGSKNKGAGTLYVGPNVTLEGITGVIIVASGSTLTSSGTIRGTEAFGISGNGLSECAGTNITISGGTVSGGDVGIYHPQIGTLTITGGAISGKTGIEMKGGTATIRGAETAVTTTTTSHVPSNNGNSTSGYAVALVENAGYATGGSDVSATITGGKFNGPVAKLTDSVRTGKETLTVTGGDFTHDPLMYVAAEHFVVGSTESGYKYAVTDVPANVEVVPPAIEVDAPEDMNREIVTAVSETSVAPEAATVLSTIAANSAITDDNKINIGGTAKTVDEVISGTEYNTVLPSADPEVSRSPVVIVQPYMDIKIIEAVAPVDDDTPPASLKLDITPMSQVYVTGSDIAAGGVPLDATGDPPNAVAVGEPQELTVTPATPISLRVGIPSYLAVLNDARDGFLPLTVESVKNGKTYYYKAEVSSNVTPDAVAVRPMIAPNYFATFTVTQGFCELLIKLGDTRMALVDYKDKDAVSISDNPVLYSVYGVNITQLPTTAAPAGQYQTGWKIADVTYSLGTLTDAMLTALDEAYHLNTNQSSADPVAYNALVAVPVFAYYPPPSTNPTLTFEVNGGSAIASVSRAEGTVVELASYKPTREGYNFIGWYSDAELSAKVTSVTLSKNTTVYAKWLKANSMDNFKLSGAYSGFTDVDESKWYGTEQEGVIRDAVMLGIVEGYGNGLFGPENSLKIGEAVKIAAVIHSIYAGDGYEFVEGSPWYKVYVDYAVEKGLIKADDFADHGAVCTRAEAAYIFAKALPAAELPAVSELTPPDVAKTDKYGEEIYLLYAAGILEGNDDAGTFLPAGSFTRAQAAAIVTRLCIPANRSK